jgi:hypothetical protein
LRETLASPVDAPEGATREDVTVSLELARGRDRGHDRWPAVHRALRPSVAVAGRTRCYFAMNDRDQATLNFVAVMCSCKREVDDGRIEGPFTSNLAAKWARLVMIGHTISPVRAPMTSSQSGFRSRSNPDRIPRLTHVI